MNRSRWYTIAAKPGEGAALEAALLKLRHELNRQGGLLSVEILRADDGHAFVFIERWRDESDRQAAGVAIDRATFAAVAAAARDIVGQTGRPIV